MILNEFIELKITRKNIDHFTQWYKDIKLKDIIKVDPNNLQKSCNIKVDVSCDVCGVERNIKFQAYTKNINSCPEYPIYTCDKCSHVKIKEYNKKKWGVEYYSQTKEYGEKFRSTMMERWGVEYALQSDELKDKAKKTNLEKFGVENPFMDSNRIQTIFKNKYGVNHPSKVNEFYKKLEDLNLKKIGYKSPLSSPIIREKINNKMLNKYGTITPMKSDKIRDCKISNDPNYIKYINDGVSFFKCDKGLDHNFLIDKDNYHNRTRSKLPLCTVCNPIGNSRSIKEDELYKFISSVYDGEIVQSYRDGLEIDIYLPDLKLGFEFNGLYWHSDEWKDRNYHLEKTLYFKEMGIRIIHIWEDDWDFKREILESQIKNWIGSTQNKIFARKCSVRVLGSVSDFLNNNHIQGVDNSSLKLGLYYNDEMVSVMTFDRFEGRKKMEEGGWNLSRFCNKLNTNVVGGASKLLNYFIKEYLPTRIVSYADRDWSDGGLYYQLGFDMVKESKPDYKYYYESVRTHKSNFKKSKLKYECTEGEYMNAIGIYRIWDCGKIKFQKKSPF